MMTVTQTQLRARYAEILDRVAVDHDEVVVTQAGHEPVVIVSLQDYESLKEMVHLMRSPANARRLLDAVERLESEQPVGTTATSRRARGGPSER